MTLNEWNLEAERRAEARFEADMEILSRNTKAQKRLSGLYLNTLIRFADTKAFRRWYRKLIDITKDTYCPETPEEEERFYYDKLLSPEFGAELDRRIKQIIAIRAALEREVQILQRPKSYSCYRRSSRRAYGRGPRRVHHAASADSSGADDGPGQSDPDIPWQIALNNFECRYGLAVMVVLSYLNILPLASIIIPLCFLSQSWQEVFSMSDNERFLSVAEIARRYSVTRYAIYGWVARGIFPLGVKLGRMRRWPLSTLQAWEKRHEIKAVTAHVERA